MIPDSVGEWQVTCEVDHHSLMGMNGLFRVHKNDEFVLEKLEGTIRTYFIAAEETMWDYGPSGKNGWTGIAFENDMMSKRMMVNNIGRVYKKARYFEYTDSYFNQTKDRPKEWSHLGILGPVIRAEVGDTIEVYFKNNLKFDTSLFPHGLRVEKSEEGAEYYDGTNRTGSVKPGETRKYTWYVPSRSGPSSKDTSSVSWVYHSEVDHVAQTNAGLIGVIIVTEKGKSTNNFELKPIDVDRELVCLLTVFDENRSPYLDENIIRVFGSLSKVNKSLHAFYHSNLMHAINGFCFSNTEGLTVRQGERVRWYQVGMGSRNDM